MNGDYQLSEHKKIIKEHWLYGKIEFKIDVKDEDQCSKCIHWSVCIGNMEKFCLNYCFGTNQGQPYSCEQCIHRYTRWNKDMIPCFKCKFFKSEINE